MSDIIQSPSQTPDLSNVPIIPGLTPIHLTLPESTSAFNQKYNNPTVQSLLSQIPPTLRASLVNYDQTRVQRGQQPLSFDQTQSALSSYQTKQAATPPPDEGFVGNAINDIQTVVSSIPTLPYNFYQEFQQLPQLPESLSAALGRGSIPDIAQGLTQVPGVRMVPGINTLSSLLNDPSQLAQHPVFTALDVLPFALPGASAATESLLGNLETVRAARAAESASGALDLANNIRRDMGLPALEPPSSLRLAIRESPVIQALGNTKLGQFAEQVGATYIHDVVQAANQAVTKGILQTSEVPPESLITPDSAIIQRAAQTSRDWQSLVPDERRLELMQRATIDRHDVLNDPSLTDTELGLMNRWIDSTDELANLGVRMNWQGQVDGEIYTPQQAARIRSSRATVGRYQSFNDTRNMIVGAYADPTVVESIDPATVMSEYLTRQDQVKLADGYAHALDAAGYDNSYLSTVIRAARADRLFPMENVRDAITDTLHNGQSAPLLQPDEMLDKLQPYAGRLGKPGDPTVAQIRAFIRVGDYQSALERLRYVSDRTTYLVPEVEDMVESTARLRNHSRYLRSTEQYNDANVLKAQRLNARIESSYQPARFVPEIERRAQARLAEMYANDADSLRLIQEHLYSQLPQLVDEQSPAQVFNEIARGWKDIRDAGFDPVFSHRVNPSAVVTQPYISDVIRTPSAARARTLDATPYVPDASVSLSSQALEYLSRINSNAFIEQILQLHGIPTQDLIDRYLPQARAAAEADPTLDVNAHLQAMMRRGHDVYDPEKTFPHVQGVLPAFSPPTETWIPRALSETLTKMFHERRSLFSQLTDPYMKVFRTAVIPLSARSFIHHFLGQAVMVTGETLDPTLLFRNWSRARDLIDSGEYAAVPGMPGRGAGDVPPELRKWGTSASRSELIGAAHQVAAGRWLKSMFDKLGPITDRFGNVVDRSYQYRGWLDDQMRAMTYLYKYDKSIAKGMTEAQAQEAGVGLVRKSMQTWDRWTPFERSIMRSIFPFYSVMNLVMRYAFRFPMEHPFRMAVVTNFARNELKDFGTAMPQRFMDTFFIGDPDPKTGAMSSIDLTPLNPFRDVANYFTLAGFTGASNPLIQSVLRAAGVDPHTGAASLYPDVTYDPVTGQLRPDNPNVLSSFLGNIIPQSQIITALLGRNDQFKQILQSNPDAAAAMLRSAAGLPNLFRNINPPQEAFKAELQREQLQSDVQKEALRTGDWSRAQDFPQLRAYFQQLAVLMRSNPQAFAPYVESKPRSTPGEAAIAGLVGMNVP